MQEHVKQCHVLASMPVNAFLVSTGIVALAEIGDKTQLLALLLAARFKKPVPIILGILVATLANHGLAGAAGGWVAHAVGAGGDALDSWRFVHCDGGLDHDSRSD